MFLVDQSSQTAEHQQRNFQNFQISNLSQSCKVVSHIKDKGDFIRNIKHIQYIPSNIMFITADVGGLNPPIPHDSGLKVHKNILDKRRNQNISTTDLIKMTEFVLRNNQFEFNGKVKQQKSGATIGPKRASTYAWICMNEFKNGFLSLRNHKFLVWLRYINDVFFIWTYGKKELHKFIEDFIITNLI